VECVTSNILKYFKGDCLKVQVYGYPDVEQKKQPLELKQKKSTKSSMLEDESTMDQSQLSGKNKL